MSLINSFDGGLSRYFARLPDSTKPFWGALTLLGEPILVISLALFAGLIAYRQGQVATAVAFALAIIGCGINGTMKLFLHRTRPDTLYVTKMRFKSYSFPSGHAFGGLLIYGLLEDFAFSHLESPYNYLSLGLISLMVLGVGISRIYLGAHYPTDVIGGWVFGGLCLILIIKFVLPL